MKLCKDCNNFLMPSSNRLEQGKCKVAVLEVSLVSGRPIYDTCDSQRFNSRRCGYNGLYFQPKSGD